MTGTSAVALPTAIGWRSLRSSVTTGCSVLTYVPADLNPADRQHVLDRLAAANVASWIVVITRVGDGRQALRDRRRARRASGPVRGARASQARRHCPRLSDPKEYSGGALSVRLASCPALEAPLQSGPAGRCTRWTRSPAVSGGRWRCSVTDRRCGERTTRLARSSQRARSRLSVRTAGSPTYGAPPLGCEQKQGVEAWRERRGPIRT